MNNQKIGNEFEKEFCELLKKKGFWVHFIERKKDGSQPFDVIACKNNKPFAFDCKTNKGRRFDLSRVEDNQEMAFELFMKKGNTKCFFAIKDTERNDIYLASAQSLIELKRQGVASVPLKELWSFYIDKGDNNCGNLC